MYLLRGTCAQSERDSLFSLGRAHRITIASAFVCALIVSSSCTRGIDFESPSREAAAGGVKNGAGQWHDPRALDQGLFNLGESVSDFSLTSDTDRALLVAGFYDGSAYRAWGRHYEPVSEGGEGWATGSGERIIDVNPLGINADNIAVGARPGASSYGSPDDVMVVLSDGASAGNTQSMIFGSDADWARSETNVCSVAPNLSGATEITSGVAWDDSGHAYYAFSSATAASGSYREFRVQRYTAYSGWDDPGGRGLQLGFSSTSGRRIQMLSDGFGATALWKGRFGPGVVSRLGNGSVANHGCYVSEFGQIRCAGESSDLQIGDGDTTDNSYMTPVAGLPTMSAVVQGGGHTCGLSSGGAVWCWGRNSNGQVGDGSGLTADVAVPTQAIYEPATSGTATAADSMRSIAAGGNFTCAVHASGGVYCWGSNAENQLGNGSTSTGSIWYGRPVVRSGGMLLEGSVVTAGDAHACAIAPSLSSSVYCWGRNVEGQVGTDSASVTLISANPVNLASAPATELTSVTSVSAGARHVCAVSGGLVYCWGDDSDGQLGRGVGSGFSSTAVQISSLVLSGVTQVAAGSEHTCALTSAGQVYCWGANGSGQLGLGVTGPAQDSPILVSEVQDIVEISAGAYHTCARRESGAAYCWGERSSGQTAQFTTSGDQLTPSRPYDSGDCGVSSTCLMTASSSDGDLERVHVIGGNGDLQAFNAATDGRGTVVVAYIDDDPSVSCASTAAGECNMRLFGAVRTAGGGWSAPLRLDESFNASLTSFYQNGGTAGKEYADPAVAYVGNGKFIVVFTLTDIDADVNGLYARTYTVGKGWSPSTEVLFEGSLAVDVDNTNQYRLVNDVRLATDRQGKAAIVLSYLVTDDTAVADRELGIAVVRYTAEDGVIDAVAMAHDEAVCPVDPSDPASCHLRRFDASLFSSGEIVVVFEGPESPGSTDMRLYSLEYY